MNKLIKFFAIAFAMFVLSTSTLSTSADVSTTNNLFSTTSKIEGNIITITIITHKDVSDFTAKVEYKDESGTIIGYDLKSIDSMDANSRYQVFFDVSDVLSPSGINNFKSYSMEVKGNPKNGFGVQLTPSPSESSNNSPYIGINGSSGSYNTNSAAENYFGENYKQVVLWSSIAVIVLIVFLIIRKKRK